MDPLSLFLQTLIRLLTDNSDIISTLVLGTLGYLAYRRASKQSIQHREEIGLKVEKIEKEIRTPELTFEELKKEVAERTALRVALRELLKDAGANRACLFKFHNGTRYYTNKHQTRCTCEVEVVSTGTAPSLPYYQNVPVHGHPVILEKITTGDPFLIKVKDIPAEFSIEKDMYNKTDVKALAGIDVPDPDSGLLLGFIVVSWTTKKVKKEEEVFPFLKAAASGAKKIVNIPER